ncbi:MAG: alpha/beta hydrolase [Desulfobacterales bacterium]|nr:alpha/beta hydrolase [Desulfobacterales bacterium]
MKKIIFHSEGYELEGLHEEGYDEEKGVVITHPHPLYGGDMYNIVVETISDAYHRKGYTTLRPNFRGVGKSQGCYDNGVGEQKDVLSALRFLFEMGIGTLDLVGYSFGAWVNAHISIKDVPLQKMLMVSPPVAFMDFQNIGCIDFLKLVVTGGRDEIASPAMIRKSLPQWNRQALVEVIEGANHFYEGCLENLKSILSNHL